MGCTGPGEGLVQLLVMDMYGSLEQCGNYKARTCFL